jgi:WD40 repeat protein
LQDWDALHLSPVTDIIFNPEKNILISESADKTIIWNLETFNLLYAFNKQPSFARQLLKHIKIFPKNQFFVYETDTTDLEIWDLTCGELFFTLPDLKDQVTAIAVTVDREQVISNSDKNGLEFWSIQDSNKPSYLSSVEHSAIVTSITTTRCNCYAISASDDHTLKVWSIKDGSLITTFTGESEITACSVLDDDLVIIAGEKSGRIHFLKLQGI